MFKRRTVFVVGAGASFEAGLPVGSELAKVIGKKLDIRFEHGIKHVGGGDIALYDQMRHQYPNEADAFQKAGWLIRDGIHLTKSVDDFLDIHSKNDYIKRVGKAAIVKSILEAERKSKLFVDANGNDQRLDLTKIVDSWYVKFMKMLGPGIRLENLDSIFENVSFIIFNYDRCVEQFLLNALQQLYAISEQRAAELMAKLQVVHPYGAVGYLRTSVAAAGVPFGSAQQNFLALGDRISTYTEQISQGDEIEKIRSLVRDAEKLIFLGFAFHEQNMRLLQPMKKLKPKAVFGTAYGMSPNDVDIANTDIAKFFAEEGGAHVHIIGSPKYSIMRDMTCSMLFDFYGKSMPA